MEQQHLKFGDYQPPDPDEDGYTPAYSTTSTSGSGRTQRGAMKNSVMFTVEAYNLKWTDIKADIARRILQQVMNKNSFDFYHYCVHKAQWVTSKFYAANFNMQVDRLNDGEERVKQLSFQVTAINPI